MILILLSWVYIYFTSLNFGILFRKVFKIENCHIIIHHILGLFLYTIVASVLGFFIRLNIEFHILILLINSVVFIKYYNNIKTHLNSFTNSIYHLNWPYKILYVFLFFIVLAQSSTKPYLLDNESYYIQTIKWLNEYGYVKGLTNLHMFLGQNSGWHTLQAGFNFSFISDIFNDINGFLYIMIGLLCIEKLNNYIIYKNIQDYSFSLILIFCLFFMQFINAPSPDLLIFTITPYVFYLFIKHTEHLTVNNFKILISLVLFLCLVKVTVAILSILVIIVFIKHYSILKTHILQYVILCVVTLAIFTTKNVIISGYLFYPIEQLDFFSFDWKTPKTILEFYNNGTYLDSFNNVNISHLSAFETFKFWITQPKLNGLFNSSYIILIVLFPFIIYKNKHKFELTVIYILSILQLCILWNNSPQYRFFFIFIIFLSIQIFITIFKNKKIGTLLVSLSVFASAIPIFFNINLNTYTSNQFAINLSTFKLENSIIPEGNSKIDTPFNKQSNNGFEFYSPSDDVFFWATGNGSLPCVNKKQINYIKDYLNYIPEQRTGNLKDGFRSKSIANN